MFFRGLYELEVDLAALAYGLEREMSVVRGHLEAAARHAQKAVDLGLGLNPSLYMTLLALANEVGRPGLKTSLENLSRDEITQENVHADDAFYQCAEAMAHLSARRVEQAAVVSKSSLTHLRGRQASPPTRAAVQTLLEMVHAIAVTSESELDASVTARQDAYARTYSQKEARNYPSGLLDLRGTGLIRIAHSLGMSVHTRSPYLLFDTF